MSKPRVVFAGTPHFALPSLEATIESGVDVVAVYTQPDRPAGRGQRLAASPVKARAIEAGIAVHQPKTLRDPIAQQGLRDLKPDLLVVVAYGLILPKAVLAIPVHGCWNVHGSMLPRWRGAAPIQRAILAGDTMTGVCLMQMDAGLDTGPVLLPLPVPIAPDETGGSLHDKLAAAGAHVLGDGLARLRANLKLVAQPQPAEGATYAAKIEKSEAVLDLSRPAVELERVVRAFHPWPVAELVLAGERLRIHAATTLSQRHDGAPGTVLSATRDGLDLACGDGVLRLLRVQREGGRPIAIADYLNARRDLSQPA